jgi:methylmalonyl-CoA epimerase
LSKTFDHLGIVVKDLDKAVSLYQDILGLKLWRQGIIEDKENGVRLTSLPTGGTFVELMQPLREDNRMGRFLKERGEGLFHLCFFCDDFDNEVKALKEKGYEVQEEEAHISEGNPFRLAWIPPTSTTGLWIELADAAAIPDDLKNHDF